DYDPGDAAERDEQAVVCRIGRSAGLRSLGAASHRTAPGASSGRGVHGDGRATPVRAALMVAVRGHTVCHDWERRPASVVSLAARGTPKNLYERMTVDAKSVGPILPRSLRAAVILVACLLIGTGVGCSKTLAERSGPTRIDYGMPERLGRQVAPTSTTPWRPPDLHGYTSMLKSSEPLPLDVQKRYELVELIDLAQRLNPETRVAWEAARQAAIGVGLVESAYFPVLTLTALGGYQSEAFPAPRPSHPLVLPPKRRHSAGVDLLNCQRRSSGVTVLSLALRH